MTRFSFERAMGVLLLVVTVILSVMMIHSPGTDDVTFFLDWTEVVYQNGLVAGYSKVVSVWSEYPPISFAILYIARAFCNTMGLSPLISFKVTILAFQLMSTGMILLLSGSYWVAGAFNASLLLSGVGLGYMDVCVAPPLIAAFCGISIEAQRAWYGIVSDCLSNQMAAPDCGAFHRRIPVRDFELANLSKGRW